MCCCYCCFFFFKQKTAYEMRISDWSSDVCSSDLCGAHPHVPHRHQPAGRCWRGPCAILWRGATCRHHGRCRRLVPQRMAGGNRGRSAYGKHMTDQFQLTEDYLAIQEMARRFTADTITPFAAEWDEKHPYTPAVTHIPGEWGFG